MFSRADPEGHWGGGGQYREAEESHQGEGGVPEGGPDAPLRQILQAQRRALQG